MENFTQSPDATVTEEATTTETTTTQADQLADDEVSLSDGRVVKMRETNGADSAGVAQMLGNKVSLEGAGSVILVQATALKAIVAIDGAAPSIMRSYSDYLKFASQFKTRDLNKLLQKYMELNSEADPADPLV